MCVCLYGILYVGMFVCTQCGCCCCCCVCICFCAIFLLSILAKHTRARHLSKGSLWRQRTRAQLLLPLPLTHSLTQWVDVKFSASLLHQQIRIHYTVLQYVRQFVPPSSSSRWHSLGNGTRSSASSKLWMEILDEIYLNISNIVFPTSCHWNSLTQGITKYYQSQITIHIPWAISISCGRWYKWDMIV